MSRYDDLPSYLTRINGRLVSLPEIPDAPTPETLQGPYLVMEAEPGWRTWDQVAALMGIDEEDAWVLAALNAEAVPDPLDIPPGAMLVLPSADRVADFADGNTKALLP